MIRDGRLICPVYGRQISITPNGSTPEEASFFKSNRKLLMIALVVAVCLIGALLFFAAGRNFPKETVTSPGARSAGSISPPDTVRQVTALPATTATPGDFRPALAPEEIHAPPDKMKIIEQIAAQYHQNHSYTLEADFVCLDMAIDVWNQLITHGIEAKIMGGNIRENITAWNFRQLARESDHAWVVAWIGPREKVAIETTEGKIIKPDMPNASVYFKGIEFDSPAQIKHFELLRRKMNDACRAAQDLINEWNQNISVKPMPAAEAIAGKSRIEQKKQECENIYRELAAFEGKAIFY